MRVNCSNLKDRSFLLIFKNLKVLMACSTPYFLLKKPFEFYLSLEYFEKEPHIQFSKIENFFSKNTYIEIFSKCKSFLRNYLQAEALEFLLK